MIIRELRSHTAAFAALTQRLERERDAIVATWPAVSAERSEGITALFKDIVSTAQTAEPAPLREPKGGL